MGSVGIEIFEKKKSTDLYGHPLEGFSLSSLGCVDGLILYRRLPAQELNLREV